MALGTGLSRRVKAILISRAPSFRAGQPCVARGPLHSDLQGPEAFSGDLGVRLPVAGLSALLPDYSIWVDCE